MIPAHMIVRHWHRSNFTAVCRALQGFDALEKILEGKDYLVNDDFSAADIAVGFSCNFLKLCKV